MRPPGTSTAAYCLANQRFEIPRRYRHLERVRLRYAHWHLANVELLVPNGPNALCRLYPIDKMVRAEGIRSALTPLDAQQPSETLSPEAASSEPLPPLLRKMLADFAATGLPSPYLPKFPATDEIEEH